jgi:hypothetical protein
MRKLFFMTMIGLVFTATIFSDIIEDALKSRYTPILGKIFYKNERTCILM